MPSKNNLSALKPSGRQAAILPKAGDKSVKTSAEASIPKQYGRPKKVAAEKRSYKITLSLTPIEGAAVAKKAGLAGEATYLYAMLKQHGIID